MSYEDAIAKVPGVTVEWAKYFGSYQGRFCAKLKIDGKDTPEYVMDYYGSCSGCDSYEASFGYSDDPTDDQLISFATPYVEAALPLDDAIRELMPKPGQWYDTEDKEMLDYILADYPEKKVLVSIFPKGSG